MASTIQIKRGTGSAVPSGLSDGELAINLDERKLYFGSSSAVVMLLDSASAVAGGGGGTTTNALTVDNATLQLNSGTTFDGSAARTISIKDGGVDSDALAANISVTQLTSSIISASGIITAEGLVISDDATITDDLTINDLNSSIKKLYKTNYFKDIKISQENKVLKITIIENPIIQSIKISGIKNKEELLELNNKTSINTFLIGESLLKNLDKNSIFSVL